MVNSSREYPARVHHLSDAAAAIDRPDDPDDRTPALHCRLRHRSRERGAAAHGTASAPHRRAGRRGAYRNGGDPEERILQAVDELGRLDSIKKTAASIQKSAGSIDAECIKIAAAVRPMLDEALAALNETLAADRGEAGTRGAA